MARKQYSDDEIAAALVKLAVNKGNYNKTSKDTGIPPMTLHRWQNNATQPAISEGVEEKIGFVVEHLLDNIPSDLKGRDWAIALGILLDKYLLIKGGVTQRTENINHNESEELGELNDREFFENINKANKAVDRLSDNSGKLEVGKAPKPV